MAARFGFRLWKLAVQPSSNPLTILYTIDLGPEVALEEMTLGDRQLVCRGQVRVHP